MVEQIGLYQASRHPILIGAASDVEAKLCQTFSIIEVLTMYGSQPTIFNEDTVIASSRRSRLHRCYYRYYGSWYGSMVQETDYERGLVVLQVGGRPNYCGMPLCGTRPAQGDPGRYHRLLTVPELEELGVLEGAMAKITKNHSGPP